MTVRPIFSWYDMWIGAYWDCQSRKLYLFPIPCCGIVLSFRKSEARIRKEAEQLFDKLNAKDSGIRAFADLYPHGGSGGTKP